MQILFFLQKHLAWWIPAFMILGAFFGKYFPEKNLHSLILPITFLMIYPQMINLSLKKIFSECHFKTQILAQILNFVFIPFVALVLAKIFFSGSAADNIGLFLIALFPTSSMTLAWTGMSQGNQNAALKISMLMAIFFRYFAKNLQAHFLHWLEKSPDYFRQK